MPYAALPIKWTARSRRAQLMSCCGLVRPTIQLKKRRKKAATLVETWNVVHVLQCAVGQVHCCVMPTEIITTITDGVPRTATTTSTQLLSSE